MINVVLSAFILLHAACFGTYYSQCHQDEFVYQHYFKDLKEGVFIDIGAHNGVSLSNSYFFEHELKWTGICVEPIPEVFAQLEKNRKCVCVQGCVTDWTGPGQFLRIRSPNLGTEMLSGLLKKYAPQHLQRVQGEIAIYGGSYEIFNVNCYLLNDILNAYGITHVNFLSIDTEGGEFDIISSIDFSRYQIDVITLEDNYGDPRFVPFLTSKGYTFVGRLDIDLLFVRNHSLSKELISDRK